MKLPFEPAIIQYLIVIVAALAVSIAVGLKRGWRGQVMAFVPIVVVWALLGVNKDGLVGSVNAGYRGLRVFLACGSQSDSQSCLESAGVAGAALVDPGNPEQVRLLLLLFFVCTVALVFLFVTRFGRRPTSLVQRLLGAVLGVANGFTLSYLVLPFLPYRQEIILPTSSASAAEDLSPVAPNLPSSLGVPSVTAGVVFVVLFVAFVILAVRLMRPTEVPVRYHVQDG
jgi:hypothetical protein